MADSLPPDSVFLANCEEATFSEILQRQQRIVLQIELVDTARPQHQMKREALRGYLIPTGGHRVQFRVLLPSAGLTDSRAREARGFFDVLLVAGHSYRVAGNYNDKPHTFHLLDMTKNSPVSPALDLGFFSPVQLDLQFIPIFIPMKT